MYYVTGGLGPSELSWDLFPPDVRLYLEGNIIPPGVSVISHGARTHTHTRTQTNTHSQTNTHTHTHTHT